MKLRKSDKVLCSNSPVTTLTFNKASEVSSRRRIASLIGHFDNRTTFIIALSVMFFAVINLPVGWTRPGGVVFALAETIATFDTDCSTPKAAWNLGGTACAVVPNAPAGRRIAWISPDGGIARVGPSFTGTGSDTYTIPATGPLAQLGTWKVESMDNAGAGFAITTFLVRDPSIANADLSILKVGPSGAVAGDAVSYLIQITNRGPDAAQAVVLSEATPNDTTFVSEVQNSGPAASCSNPSTGGTGTSTCAIPTLAPGEIATFTFVYSVNAGTQVDTLISNTAAVSSTTNELFQPNNSANYVFVVGSTPVPSSCTVSCPANVSVNNDPGGPNPCSAVVAYSTPAASGNCTDPETGDPFTVVCSPPSGANFPVGVTTVTCSSGATTCSFTVTVNDTRPPAQPTITCPGNVTVDELSPGVGFAVVGYAPPVTTGNCVTVVCDPPSGALFSVGSTVVNCTGTDSANNTVACSFTVTVNGAGCTITCPGDVSVTSSQCSAVVNYSAPTTSGSCGTITCTPTSGSTFPLGVTAVTCSATGGSSCSFAVTVIGPELTALGTAQVWVGLKNSDDVGTKFDLLAEVLKNGAVIGSGQTNDLAGGSSGFNNAILDTINVALSSATNMCSGDTLSFRLSVRVAAGSGHRSGTARLWYNDAAANSRFNATVSGAASDNFLLDGFLLGGAAGPGPKKTIDVTVDRAVGGNPFKPFGTWTKTF